MRLHVKRCYYYKRYQESYLNVWSEQLIFRISPSVLDPLWLASFCSLQLWYIMLTKSSMGREGLLSPITEGTHDRSSMLRSWGSGGMLFAGLLSMTCSATFFIQLRSTCLGMVLLTMGWDLLHKFAIKEMSTEHTLWVWIYDWDSFCPEKNDSSLYRVDQI